MKRPVYMHHRYALMPNGTLHRWRVRTAHDEPARAFPLGALSWATMTVERDAAYPRCVTCAYPTYRDRDAAWRCMACEAARHLTLGDGFLVPVCPP